MSSSICVYSSAFSGGGCERGNAGSVLGESFGGRLLAQQPVLQTEAVTAWEAKADLHYKRWLSCFCQALRLPSTGTYSPENPELEAEDRAGSHCPWLPAVTVQSTAPVAPREFRGAELGLSPAALRYLIRVSVGERRKRLVKDIIRIVIRSREQRSRERRKWKSSSAIALGRNHVSFSAVKSFRKDRREGSAVHLTNPRRQVGTVGITGERFLMKAGGCTQRARAAHWEQASAKWCRGLLLAAIVGINAEVRNQALQALGVDL